ncbi:MAG: ATP-binding protein [Kiritimatiellae bacterium]|nr:ATP-binding protein [Kiritimatiellia bacterium]
MDFIDREEEQKRFRRFLNLREGALACVYGRRRIGKSRLIEEVVSGRKDVVVFVAERSEAALQRSRLAADISSLIPWFADVAYDNWSVMFNRWQKDAPKGSILVIDELPYLVERSPELPSVLQRIADGLRPTGKKMVLCGSSQRMMQGLVLNENEPLYGRAREIVKLEPIHFRWMKNAFPGLSAWERFCLYAVLGGVPRYWETFQGEDDMWAALREQVFSPQGLFHDEPNHVLQDDLQDSVQATSVLSLVGRGVERLVEIAGRLQVPATALGRPIKRLMELGLVTREIPFGSDAKSNKKTLYRISDPFLRFWYSFVLPNYSDANFLSDRAEIKALQPAFRVYLGQAWERLVRDEIQRRPLPGLDMRFRNAARWWGSGLDRKAMEIDIVAESLDGETLLVGEAKLSLPKTEAVHALRDLEAKARQLPFASKYKRIVSRLFVAQDPPTEAVSVDWCEA